MTEEFLRVAPAPKPTGGLAPEKGGHRRHEQDADLEHGSAEFAELMEPRKETFYAEAVPENTGEDELDRPSGDPQVDRQTSFNLESDVIEAAAIDAESSLDSGPNADRTPTFERDVVMMSTPSRETDVALVEARLQPPSPQLLQRDARIEGEQALSTRPLKLDKDQPIKAARLDEQTAISQRNTTATADAAHLQSRVSGKSVSIENVPSSKSAPLPEDGRSLSSTVPGAQSEPTLRGEAPVVTTSAVQTDSAPQSSKQPSAELRSAPLSNGLPEQMRTNQQMSASPVRAEENHALETRLISSVAESSDARVGGDLVSKEDSVQAKPTGPAVLPEEMTAPHAKTGFVPDDPRNLVSSNTSSGSLPINSFGRTDAAKPRAVAEPKPLELALQPIGSKSSDIADTLVQNKALTEGQQSGMSAKTPVPNAIATAPPNFVVTDQDRLKVGGDAEAEVALSAVESDRANSKSLTQLHLVQTAKSAEPHARAVIAQIREVAISADQRVTEIQLNPEELGRVRLTFGGGEVAQLLSIQVDRPETLDLVRRNLELLRQELSEAGYDMSNVSLTAEGQRRDGQEDTAHADSSVIQANGEKFDQEEDSLQVTSSRVGTLVDGRLDLRF